MSISFYLVDQSKKTNLDNKFKEKKLTFYIFKIEVWKPKVYGYLECKIKFKHTYIIYHLISILNLKAPKNRPIL